jgi:hypothetical protein
MMGIAKKNYDKKKPWLAVSSAFDDAASPAMT